MSMESVLSRYPDATPIVLQKLERVIILVLESDREVRAGHRPDRAIDFMEAYLGEPPYDPDLGLDDWSDREEPIVPMFARHADAPEVFWTALNRVADQMRDDLRSRTERAAMEAATGWLGEVAPPVEAKGQESAEAAPEASPDPAPEPVRRRRARNVPVAQTAPEPAPDPMPSDRPIPRVKPATAKPKAKGASSQDISARWRVRRIHNGKPRFSDLIHPLPESVIGKVTGWAVFGPGDEDVVARIGTNKPVIYRYLNRSGEWVGGFGDEEVQATLQATMEAMHDGKPGADHLTGAAEFGFKSLAKALAHRDYLIQLDHEEGEGS